MTNLEEKIEIMKYLHKPHTINEVTNKFNISERTFRDLFSNDNVNFLNVEFPLYKRKIEGKMEYLSDSETLEMIEDNSINLKSTVHPVFLPLNLTEVYALTTHLIDITKGTSDQKIYREIANKIYAQLSDYAKEQICLDNSSYPLWKNISTVKYISEKDMMTDLDKSDFLFALKLERVEITLTGNRTITGKVKFEDGSYYIIDSSGVKTNLDDISEMVLYIKALED